MSIRVGDQIPSTHKKVYQRALAEREFAADSIHNDQYTRSRGYPGALVSAYVLTGYISELMVNFFGQSWLSTGKYQLAFVGKGLQQGDQITCGGVVTAIDELPDGDQAVQLDVWIEKHGARPVLGRASGVLRAATAGRALAQAN
ncbi:MAG: hypothetical protein JO157_06525 [Acetobacteraceae bacterium]|nr:hypothetical protein [Acetobacteraceae bacterium]